MPKKPAIPLTYEQLIAWLKIAEIMHIYDENVRIILGPKENDCSYLLINDPRNAHLETNPDYLLIVMNQADKKSGGFGTVYNASHRITLSVNNLDPTVEPLLGTTIKLLKTKKSQGWKGAKKEATFFNFVYDNSCYPIKLSSDSMFPFYAALIMKTLGQYDLSTLIAQAQLSFLERLKLARAVLIAYDKLPAELVHHDLKPSNIRIVEIDNDYEAKFTDFGLATFWLNPTQSRGTKNYLAPEKRLGQRIHSLKKSDYYSLHEILINLLLDPSHESLTFSQWSTSPYISLCLAQFFRERYINFAFGQFKTLSENDIDTLMAMLLCLGNMFYWQRPNNLDESIASLNILIENNVGEKILTLPKSIAPEANDAKNVSAVEIAKTAKFYPKKEELEQKMKFITIGKNKNCLFNQIEAAIPLKIPAPASISPYEVV